jgi:hypothetical protein
MSGIVSYGIAYTVVHNELSLLKVRMKWHGSGMTAVSHVSGITAGESIAVGHLNYKVEWSRTWPDYETVKATVTKWISTFQKDELALLDALFKDREHLPTPLEFAMQMRQTIPLTTVFNFMRNHGFIR